MSMTISIEKMDLGGLRKLLASAIELENSDVTVGVHPEDDARTPSYWEWGIERGLVQRESVTSNAEIGMRMEFGYTSQTQKGTTFNIPARSWLRVPMGKLFHEKVKAIQPGMVRSVERKDSFDGIADMIAEEAYDHIIDFFDTKGQGSWGSNNPQWAEEKGNDNPLHGKTLQLRNAIDAKVHHGSNNPF